MQQDCTWIMVPLIWYRVIPPCWCNSPAWIPFGSPAPKLDLRSPQGVSVLINVAGPNSRELIQLWSDHRHICLTLHPSLRVSPCVSTGIHVLHLLLPVRSHCIWKCHMSDVLAPHVTSSNQCEEWKAAPRSFFHIRRTKNAAWHGEKTAPLNCCNRKCVGVVAIPETVLAPKCHQLF